MIRTKQYKINDLSVDNVLRYMGIRNNAGDAVRELVEKALPAFLLNVKAKVCFDIFDVTVTDDTVSIDGLTFHSKNLAKHLAGCEKAVLMAATAGASVDRYIARMAVKSSVSELAADAMGTEAIEKICDLFCEELSETYSITSRFSPGYGDLSLDTQKDMVLYLDTGRKIGLSLTDSLMMAPTKSVTAIVGIRS